jgi:hypothetical protein
MDRAASRVIRINIFLPRKTRLQNHFSKLILPSFAKMALVLYHYPCPDGVFAAAAANLHFRQSAREQKTTFMPHRTFAPLTVEDLNLRENRISTVYLLDFAGPPGFAQELAKAAPSVRCVVIDHHKTAAAELTSDPQALPSNLEVTFDMARSGAMLALDYFAPQGLTAAQRRLYEFIQDADLWEWKLEHSKEFHAGLMSFQFEFDVSKNPGIFEQLLTLDPDDVIAAGRADLRRQQEIVEDALKTAFIVNLGGPGHNWGQALAVEVPADVASLRSQLGNALAGHASSRGLRAMGLVAYREAEMAPDSEDIKVSLRSVGETEDTTVISSLYGGGGHLNASAFLLKAEEFQRWKA